MTLEQLHTLARSLRDVPAHGFHRVAVLLPTGRYAGIATFRTYVAIRLRPGLVARMHATTQRWYEAQDHAETPSDCIPRASRHAGCAKDRGWSTCYGCDEGGPYHVADWHAP